MEESDWDPTYEYLETPQYVDFEIINTGRANADGEPVDAWFYNKGDDEVGAPIPKDFQPETKQFVDSVDMRLHKEKETANESSPGKATDGDKSKTDDNVLENGHKSNVNESIPGEVTNVEKSKIDDNVHEHNHKSEVGSNEIAKKPSNIVTSWDNWNRNKAKDYQAVVDHKAEHTTEESETSRDEPRKITRAQKRSMPNMSACVTSKKQKEMPKHREDECRRSKRANSLSNEKKPTALTMPITPQCLKRQNKIKPDMVKLKTTEEMEMECIAKLRKRTRDKLKANETSMKKAISSSSYLPVRTNTDPTKPQEFNFETDKRVKAHSMVTRADDPEKEFLKSLRQHPPSPTWKHKNATIPKPFNLSGGQTKRKHGDMDKDDKVTDSYESMAYQVYKFQTTTPPRFRTKKANETTVETTVEHGEKPARKLTQPKTPKLSTSSRARPVSEEVLSKEEREKREVEAMKSYQFKARPFDRRIVECEGLYGVKKRDEQKQMTLPMPFTFESDERLEIKKQEKKTENQEERPARFKALPKPEFDKVFRPQLKHESTASQPFSFTGKDKERYQRKEEKIQEIYKEEEKLREFKAQPLPPDSPDTLPPVSSKSCTSFKPFSLSTENRGAIKAEKWIQKVQTELQEERKKTVFKANANKVTHETPFVPQKSQKALTEVSEFSLNTNRRAERREELETHKKERQQIDEELRKEREAKRAEEEKKEIALLRKQLIHKAQPIHKYKNVVVKPSDRPLTEAMSPAWSDLKRRRLDNCR